VKFGATPEGLLERVVTFAGLAPTPIVETFHAMIVARAIMVGTRLGVFDVLAGQPLTAAATAERLSLNESALEKLLNLLLAMRYLSREDGRYGLTRMARTWMVGDAPNSLRDNMLLRFLEWEAVEGTEQFVRTGKSLDAHDRIQGDDWRTYQRGMRSLARLSAGEVTRRIRIPRAPRAMLDIGGAHGTYSVAFCRRYPTLTATILDLPQAVEVSAPILAEEQMGDRVVFSAGNALTEDLGRDRWDFIFVAHLVHHFDKAANADLIRRAADALRPGGLIAILDVLRSTSPEKANATGALLDLFFAVTSNSGTWSYDELADWVQRAGLVPGKVVHLRTSPGISVVTGTKPPLMRK
jgi:predicted O-methyltransferase YrrM